MNVFSSDVFASGPLTDSELRLTPVPVVGNVTTGGLTDTQLRLTPVPVTANAPSSTSSTVTQVTSNSANQTLIAANANRKKVILSFNTGVWSVKFGATASTTSRTVFVNNTATIISEETWKGQIDAICTTNGKTVDVTELI